jgi:hypothetical protein
LQRQVRPHALVAIQESDADMASFAVGDGIVMNLSSFALL